MIMIPDKNIFIQYHSGNLKNGSVVKGGYTGSNGYVEIGCDAVTKNVIVAGGNTVLRDRARIDGDASASGTITRQNGAIVNGIVREGIQISPLVIKVDQVTPGTQAITVQNGATMQVQPGSYGVLHAYANTIVKLASGTYSFRSFLLEPDVRLQINSPDGKMVAINVLESLQFGDRTKISFDAGTVFPLSVQFFTAQTSGFSIGTDCVLAGIIRVPNANISVASRTSISGSLYGKRVVLEPDVTVCGAPILSDIWHSQWSYSPTFDPLVFDYKAVVPDATAQLSIIAQSPDTTAVVKVNGAGAQSTFNLTSATTIVPIQVSSSQSCGSSAYNMRIDKATQAAIYVNDDSPCLVENENGLSWATAFKDLQQGIDAAAVSGKSIFLSEGVYKPTKRTNQADPRSATFLVQPGIYIRGSFAGTETDTLPTGSPYRTLLSGDLAGNDAQITQWPPAQNQLQWLSDNSYHVVTVNSTTSSSQIKMKGITIEHGAAIGISLDSKGAGMFCLQGSVVLVRCRFNRNYATGEGAGLWDIGVKLRR